MEMDRIKTKQTETVKDIPPVPIKTYKWEDVRRERRKGRYPYTYLDRDPYSEETDPLEYRMDTLRPSKSASVLEKSSSGVNIQEIVDDNGKSTNNDKHYLEPPNEGIVDAADSSNEDNISQYLDRDDDPPIITEHIETPGPSNEEREEQMDVVDDKDMERAKSEEPKRKRKLSIESSYSRISLSRLGVMKKLREAKEKLKLPKFSFSKSESKLDIPKKNKKDGKKTTAKDTKKPLRGYVEPKKNETPVYIHIPLKPPPGQTDEFSYLEFGDSKTAPIKRPSTPTDTPTEEEVNATESIDETGKESVQFIILTAPSDDEKLDDPGSASPNGNAKKFFDTTKLKDLKSFAKDVDEISPDMPIEGIIFEDVIQVEYVDEHNNPIGTTKRSNFLEITEENLPKLEKQLSQRNLAKELEKEIASSMDSLNKIARKNTLKKLKEQQKARSIETLKKVVDESNKGVIGTQEAPELTTPSCSSSFKEKADDLADISEPKKEEKQEESKNNEKQSEAKIEEVSKPEVEETTKITSMELTDDKAMFDEEDGLKITETTVKTIHEKQEKEQLLKTAEETLKAKPDSIKKKVSFKRRSKQEDPDGIYEDVKVSGKTGDGNNKNAKELKVIKPTQSMSVDEEKNYLDDKIVKTTSLEEDYNKWSKLTDHEYEPVNPPVDNNVQQPPQSVTNITVKRTESKESRKSRESKRSPSNSIRIRLKDDDLVQSDEEIDSGDALTAEDLQTRIEDQFFNNSSVPEQDNATNTTNTTIPTISSKESGVPESRTKKFHDALKTQAGNLRIKMKNIKKPNIHMPQRPNFERFKIQKPNISIPKIPDQMRVNLPSFTLPKKSASTKKRSIKERQFSTESNAGDSKKKLFDFSTYPRIFGKKKKSNDIDGDFETSSTVPRVKKSTAKKKNAQSSGKAKETEKKKKSPDVVRIPLHSEESMDKANFNLSSHGRYDDDIDMNDEYLKESQQMHMASESSNDFNRNRWNHGSFHGHNLNEIEDNDREIKVTDLDNEVDMPQTSPEPEIEIDSVEADIRQSDARVVSSTGDIHRQGVLEKINSDEYFIREKGISQDNIQMGELLTAEIREAFKQPINSLAKIENDSFDREFDVSDQSIQDIPKRRAIKKPKRKTTPNVSKERIPYDHESEPEEYPQPHDIQPQPEPARPKRKSKQKKKTKDDDRPPYQETILVQGNQIVQDFDVMRKAVSDNTLLSDRTIETNQFRDDHYQQEYPQLFDNGRLLGFDRHREELHMMDDYDDDDNMDGYNKNFSYENERLEFDRMNILGSGLEHHLINNNLDNYEKRFPAVPPRKQRSMKSLESEHDSITDEYNLINESLPQQNIEAYRVEHEYIIPTLQEPPIRPQRTTRSRTRSESRATDQPEDDRFTVEPDIPCIEEPCIEKTVDYMGYAVIEKSNKCREPPLPPPTRRKKSNTPLTSDTKFSTVPRSVKEEIPVRPMRNYSTLVPKSKRPATNIEEDKENIDLGQYIEIDDEEDHSRLQSGDIVQKMKDRPLPAPPRPPRKTKDWDKDAPFKDITHKNNADEEESITEEFEEAEVSVQTEPLPDDFVCEEFVREKGDRTITPTPNKTYPPLREVAQGKSNEAVTFDPRKTHAPITEFENVETITHGALIVATVPNDFQEGGPITNFSRSTEKIITIRREVDNEEVTSEPPENFKSLKEPQPQIIERIIERPIHTTPEVGILKAQKLQITDLDVDRLTVNELLASKIKVSEIDGDSITVAEINPKSGNLIIGGLELPVNFLQDIMEKLTKAHSSAENQPSQSLNVIQEQESVKLIKTEKADSASESKEIEVQSKQEDNELLAKTKEAISIIKEEEKEQQQAEKAKESVSKHEDNVTLDIADTLSTKLEEAENKQNDTLPLKNEEASENLSEKKHQAETEEELSSNTIQETIDYLDKLIKENAALNLEEKIEDPDDNEDILQTILVSSEEKPILTEEQTSVDETSEVVPSLIPDTSEEERLLEELKSSSSEQKKTPFEKQITQTPKRPPRQSEIQKFQQSQEEIFIPSQIIENSQNILLGDTPPPRPPDPEERLFLRSQPPPSFYTLRSPILDNFVDDDIPLPPRRKRPPRPPSRSSSEEPPPTTSRSRRHRTPEPSIPQLTGQLTRACVTAGDKAFKRLIKHITMNVLRNADGRQDLHVMILILLVLIAGLILLGDGDPIVHHHHWEYFNPPKDL